MTSTTITNTKHLNVRNQAMEKHKYEIQRADQGGWDVYRNYQLFCHCLRESTADKIVKAMKAYDARG